MDWRARRQGKAPVGFKCPTKHCRAHPQIHAELDRGGAEQGRSDLQAGGGQGRQQPPFGGAVECAARRFARCGVRVALCAGCYPRSVPHYGFRWTAGGMELSLRICDGIFVVVVVVVVVVD